MKFLLDRGERTVFENSTGFENNHKHQIKKEKHPSEFNEFFKQLTEKQVVSLGPQVGRWLLSLLFLSGVPCQKKIRIFK